MNRTRRIIVAITASTLLGLPTVACGVGGAGGCTDDAFTMAIAAPPKPKAPAAVPAAPKVVVKEPKRGSGGTIVIDAPPPAPVKTVTVLAVDHDDDCDDDD